MAVSTPRAGRSGWRIIARPLHLPPSREVPHAATLPCLTPRPARPRPRRHDRSRRPRHRGDQGVDDRRHPVAQDRDRSADVARRALDRLRRVELERRRLGVSDRRVDGARLRRRGAPDHELERRRRFSALVRGRQDARLPLRSPAPGCSARGPQGSGRGQAPAVADPSRRRRGVAAHRRQGRRVVVRVVARRQVGRVPVARAEDGRTEEGREGQERRVDAVDDVPLGSAVGDRRREQEGDTAHERRFPRQRLLVLARRQAARDRRAADAAHPGPLQFGPLHRLGHGRKADAARPATRQRQRSVVVARRQVDRVRVTARQEHVVVHEQLPVRRRAERRAGEEPDG